jgi:hypothetical protein
MRNSSRPSSAILKAVICAFWSDTERRSALTKENPPAIMMVITAMTRIAVGSAKPRRSMVFDISESLSAR